MKISVVVPTYKRPQLLLRCVESLFNQDFRHADYEIIIVSDGPDHETQQSLLQLKNNGPIVRYLALAEKRGPAAARNLGWKASRAKLIAFTDDDCLPDRHWLSALWSAFLRTPGSKAAFTGKTVVPISNPPTDYEKNVSHLERAEFITANCACTPAALNQVRGLDEAFTMAWREDSDLQFKLLASGIAIVRVNNAVVTHPVRKAPWGISIREERKGVFNALLYKKWPGLYRKRIQSSPPIHYYAIVLSMILFVIAILFSSWDVAAISFTVWVVITAWFAITRLRNTSRTFGHISEMLVTSMLIPFLSIFYRIYGAVKYRAPLIP